MLLSGEVNAEICSNYPELSESLPIQLKMFHLTYQVKTLANAQQTIQGMGQEVRNLFPSVEQLVRLMLICPVTSCAAERSFSALRRLKTWLRSTMTECRLNSVIVCHTNKHMLDEVNLKTVAAEFCRRSDIRKNVFGFGFEVNDGDML
jgi:hAT family C-terminal dimerisation region